MLEVITFYWYTELAEFLTLSALSSLVLTYGMNFDEPLTPLDC